MARTADHEAIDRLAAILSRSHVTAYLRLFGGLAGSAGRSITGRWRGSWSRRE